MTKSIKIVSFSPKQTRKFAKKIIEEYPDKVICLFGDLGSGKTVFVQGIGEKFWIKNVKSPSYTILREYPLGKNKKLYHYDFYRFEDENEILGINFDEHVNEKGSIVVIEWADRVRKYLPENRLEVYFKYMGENKREIRICRGDFKKSLPKKTKISMTKTKIQKLIKEFHVPKHILAHSKKVAKVALFLGKKLIQKGEKVDLDLIEKGALLHDIVRICDFDPWEPHKFSENQTKRELEKWNFLRKKFKGIHHADAAYQIFMEKGYKNLAKVILKHKFVYILDKKFAPKTWEEKIVYYADKRVKHDKIVSLKERISDGKQRNVRGKKALALSAKAEKKVYELEKEIFEKIGEKPEVVNNQFIL